MRNALFLALTLAIARPLPAQDPPTTDPQDVRAELRKQVDEELRQLPSLGTMPMDRIMQIQIENKDLIIRSALKPIDAQAKVEVPGMGTVVVTVRESPPDITSINLVHQNFTRPGATFEQTTVMSWPNVHIARESESDQQLTSVSLVQNLIVRRTDPGQSDGAVHLYISRSNHETGHKVIDLKLAAPNVVELLRRHPREVAEYLRPIFRDLQQEEAVFAVEDAVAWQVLASLAKPDAALDAQIQPLVKQLGAEKAAERESAAESLRRLGAPGLLALMRLPRANLSPEQNAQIDVLLEPYRSLSKRDAETMFNDIDFLLNTLASEDASLRRLALQRLEEKLSRKLTIKIDAPLSQRLAAIAELRAQVTTQPSD